MKQRRIVINLAFDEENPYEERLYDRLVNKATSVISACLGEARNKHCLKDSQVQKILELIDEQDEIERSHFSLQKLEEDERITIVETFLNG